jgi:hypothetical protein
MLNYDPDGMSVQDFVDYWQGYIFVFNEELGRWQTESLHSSADILAEHFGYESSDGYCDVCRMDMDRDHDCDDYWVSGRQALPHELMEQRLTEAFRDRPHLQVSPSVTINPLTMWDDPRVLTHSPRGGYVKAYGEIIYLRKLAPRSRNRGVQHNTYASGPAMAGISAPEHCAYSELLAAVSTRWGRAETVVLDENTAAVMAPDEQNREAWQSPGLQEHLLMTSSPRRVAGSPDPEWPWSPHLPDAPAHMPGNARRSCDPQTASQALCSRMNAGWPVGTPGNRGTTPRRNPDVITECSRLLKAERMVLLVGGMMPTGRARGLYETQIHNAARAAEEAR